jgi:plastocyanin
MLQARHLSAAVLSALLVAACTEASAGWTYAPAPSKTPAAASASGSAEPSGSAAPGGSAAPSGPAGPNVVQISAASIKFEQSTVTAPVDTPFQIQFDNKDAGVPHNVAIRTGDANGPEIFKGTVFNGVETRVYDVPALDAGAYAFVCDVHPTMIGTLNVQ